MWQLLAMFVVAALLLVGLVWLWPVDPLDYYEQIFWRIP